MHFFYLTKNGLSVLQTFQTFLKPKTLPGRTCVWFCADSTVLETKFPRNGQNAKFCKNGSGKKLQETLYWVVSQRQNQRKLLDLCFQNELNKLRRQTSNLNWWQKKIVSLYEKDNYDIISKTLTTESFIPAIFRDLKFSIQNANKKSITPINIPRSKKLTYKKHTPLLKKLMFHISHSSLRLRSLITLL